MSATSNPTPIRVGLIADEPIRLAGLASIFEQCVQEGHVPLLPLPGSIEELLAVPTLEYLVLDLNSSSGGLRTLEAIRRARPEIRLIVIGPPKNDKLVLDSIVAGARAYLDSSAGPEVVRQAIEVVTSGSIWAPRQLLAKLIDRLLAVHDSTLTGADPHLTARERQVLELILMARSNREIARQLGIEERTVKAHVGRLMRKTGADNRIELSIRALNRSMVPDAGVVERRRGERRQSGRLSSPVTPE
ncbi:MAG: response regulator transcription factor [Terracidiphilus sp.]|jgi:DNA-binding NarL/FixJ family response regulator